MELFANQRTEEHRIVVQIGLKNYYSICSKKINTQPRTHEMGGYFGQLQHGGFHRR